MSRGFSIRTMSVVAGLATAVLSSTYYLMKLRQECGATPLLSCALRQAVGWGRSAETDKDGRVLEDATAAAERHRREREDAERRIRTAEELRKAAEEKLAANEARKLAEQKERAAEDARKKAAEEMVLAALDGMWQGVYSGGQNPRPVNFVMTLQVHGNSCRGRIEEPNTFGHPSAARLYANVECRLVAVRPQRLVFRKTYDGTGGQSHSVDYDGEISVDGRSVTGSWRIGTLSGPFSLARQ